MWKFSEIMGKYRILDENLWGLKGDKLINNSWVNCPYFTIDLPCFAFPYFAACNILYSE